MALLIWYTFNKGHYFVAEPDECTYYSAARMFSETNSVAGPIATEGKTSIIGHCNWYGPMYSLLYGAIAKVFGISIYDFISLNVFCLVLTLLFIYKLGFDEQARLFTITAFMSGYAFVVYVFEIYPEPLHLLFDTILVLQLKRIYDAYNKNAISSKAIIIYALLVLLFSTFRVTSIFWVFGLVAFARSKKELYKMLGLCLLLLFIVMVYMHYFNAPYNAGMLPKLLSQPLSSKECIWVFKESVQNVYIFITHATSFYDGIYVLLLIIAVYNVIKTGNRFMLSAVIVSVISIIVLLAFYVPDSSFLNKQTAYFYPLLLVPIFYAGLPEIKKFTIIIFLFFAPITYLKAYGQIELRKHTYIVNEQINTQDNKVEGIKPYIENGKPQHILMVLDDIDYAPYIYLYTHLPFSTNDSYTISYIEKKFPYFPVGKMQYNQCFMNNGNIYADYILSKDSLSLDSISLIYSTDIFHLYKNNHR